MSVGSGSVDYRCRVRREFAALKSIASIAEAVGKSLQLADGAGSLMCVGEVHAEDEATIGLLSHFRAGVTTFPGTFRVTAEGTRRWLRASLLDVPDRILFLVYGHTGRILGHLGFAHADNAECRMEIDNVIRGVPDVQPGIMAAAVKRLVEWADCTCGPAEIHLRVLDDNHHAIRFYTNLGFARIGNEPLRRQESHDEIRYVPIPPGDSEPADLSYACMRLQRTPHHRGQSMLRSA